MSSPIDYIEEGIRNGNWETVCEGFERLTGKALPMPNQTNTSEAMQKIYDIVTIELRKKICEKVPVTNIETSKKGKKIRKKTKKDKKKKITSISKDGEDSSIILQDTNRTPGPRNVGTVQHITNIPDPTEVARNKEKAAKTSRVNLTKRPIAKKYKVKCNECQEKFDSDRPKGEMGQKCSKCLNNRKSQFV